MVIGRGIRRRQHGPSRADQGRLLPGAAGGFAAGHPLGDGACAAGDGRGVRGAPPRSGSHGAERNRHQVQQPGEARRLDDDPQVCGAQRRALLRQDRDLHAEARGGRQRLGHARASVARQGRQEPVYRQRLRGIVRSGAALHRRHPQARQGAQRHHLPWNQLLQAPGAGFRGADQSRVLLAQPLGRSAGAARFQPESAPYRSALPGSHLQSVSRVHRDDDGGARRHPEQDQAGRSDRQEPL